MTFSLVARDAASGQLGVGAVTAMVGVGKLVTHARPRLAAIATQAMINPYLAYDAFDLLARGRSAQEALDEMIAGDPGREFRQCGLVDGSGNVGGWTGRECPDWAGHILEDDLAAQGNRLVGRETLEAVVAAYHEHGDQELAWRIYAALLAGEETGADKQGALSAAITVMDTEEYPLWDVRVDRAEDPVVALESLMKDFEEQLLPQVRKLSTRDDPEGQLVREQGTSIG